MKLLVTIPLGLHNDLLGRCEMTAPRYSLLKNGVLAEGSDGEQLVNILCGPTQAYEIIAWVRQIYSDADSRISISPGSVA